MNKELIITIVIVVLITILDISTQNYTKKSVEDINMLLGELQTGITSKTTNDNIKNMLSNIEKEWERRKGIMVLYIEHDELEKVGTQISEIKGNIEVQLLDESIPYINNCKFLLNHIREKEAFNLKNIF